MTKQQQALNLLSVLMRRYQQDIDDVRAAHTVIGSYIERLKETKSIMNDLRSILAPKDEYLPF